MVINVVLPFSPGRAAGADTSYYDDDYDDDEDSPPPIGSRTARIKPSNQKLLGDLVHQQKLQVRKNV
jgi:hypothetical protein